MHFDLDLPGTLEDLVAQSQEKQTRGTQILVHAFVVNLIEKGMKMESVVDGTYRAAVNIIQDVFGKELCRDILLDFVKRFDVEREVPVGSEISKDFEALMRRQEARRAEIKEYLQKKRPSKE